MRMVVNKGVSGEGLCFLSSLFDISPVLCSGNAATVPKSGACEDDGLQRLSHQQLYCLAVSPSRKMGHVHSTESHWASALCTVLR